MVTWILIGVCLVLLAGASYLYFRPPSGDMEPVSEAAILYYLRRKWRSGEEE